MISTTLSTEQKGKESIYIAPFIYYDRNQLATAEDYKKKI